VTAARRRAIVYAVLAVLLAGGIVASAALGQLAIAPAEVVGTLLRSLGIPNPWAPADEIVAQTLWQIRFPRIAMSILVGGLLAVAGAVMQAVFGNPLAEPGVVGVSAGAALGASIAIAFGGALLGGWTVAVGAFVGGFLATLIVYSTARSRGRTEVVTLLLTGIAVNAFAGAGLALVLFAGSTASREQIIFWQLGSLNGSRWSDVLVVVVVAIPSVAAALLLSRRFDLLALGERTASHLGVRVEILRIASVVIVALLTGVAVAFVGIIAFVGLVIPHLVRMLLGPSHRTLLVGSLLGGAALMVWADLIARTAIPSADLPIGLLTSLIGGPFFYWLIRRNRAKAGGWA
jgi:iron complex transport system permease protein